MATLLEANEVTKIYAKGQRPSLNKVSLVLCQDLVQVKMRNFSPF